MSRRLFYFLWILLPMLSCEDVIEVETPTTEPKLIVNGLIRVDVSEEIVPVEIRVTETDNFFGETPVTQIDEAMIVYGVPNPARPELFESLFSSTLAETEPGSGIYAPDPNFSSDQRIRTASLRPDMVFILIIDYGDRRYVARTPYSPVVPIDNLEQGEETLFDEDDIEVLVTITDTPDITNYYVFDFGFNEFLALDDQFIDGQEFEFSYFYDDLEPGQEIEVSVLGADLEFYSYIDLLVEQTQEDGGVFETPAITVRGNVFDVTGIDNLNIFDNVERPDEFALGYFAVVQEFKETLTIE